MKRFLVVGAILLLLGLFTYTKVSADTIGNYEYTLDEGGNAIITKCTDLGAVICDIPQDLGGHTVRFIGDYAFSALSSLQRVTVPKTVVGIGEGAFMGDTVLQTVLIQGMGLNTIGKSAFWGCTELQAIYVPDSLQTIGEAAFYSCEKLDTIVLSANVKTIGAQAFDNTKVIIDAPDGSEAQNYAKNNGVSYYTGINSIALNLTNSQMSVSSSLQLIALYNTTEQTQITHSIVRDDTVQWTTSDAAVATVDGNGLVTARGNGKATIKVSTRDGRCSATCEIDVGTPLTSVTMNQKTAKVKVGSTVELKPIVTPATATLRNIVWETSNEKVATVKDGVVTGVDSGTVVITARVNDGNFVITSEVKVVQAVTSITLSPSATGLGVGKTISLYAQIYPSKADDKSVTWVSSNPAVATVDSKGVVTGVSNGTATITAYTVDGNYSAESRIVVQTPITSFALNYKEFKLNIGKSVQLATVVTPTTASVSYVQWSSSDTKVATVSANGFVQALSNGTTTITAMTYDNKYIASCILEVITDLESIAFAKKEETIEVGDSKQLLPTFYPATATNKRVKWVSSNPSVLTVNDTGIVMAVKDGTTIITVTSEDGKCSATMTCKVKTSVKSIRLSETELILNPENRHQLQVTIMPENATNKHVLWKSSDISVAEVDEDGLVTAIANGYARITATTEDGAKVKKCNVSVITPVTSVKLNAKKKTLEKSKTYQLKATVKPSTASDKGVMWKSSNKKVATVNSKGLVKAVGKGTAMITVTTKDGNYTAEFKVTVKNPTTKSKDVTKVVLSVDNVDKFVVNKEYKIKAKITPSNATNKTLTWKSSNSKVVSVTKTGKIKTLQIGEVKITAKASNGKKGTLTIRVE